LIAGSFDVEKASKVDTSTDTFPRSGNALRPEVHLRFETAAVDYLRAAQAYILISMPTGTSTIFGVFQAIMALLVKRTNSALASKLLPNGKFAS
jgi:hypothetical protein